jgi:hypothetical protein
LLTASSIPPTANSETRPRSTHGGRRLATIYAIQANASGGSTPTLLQSYGGGRSKGFLLPSTKDILTTFNRIGAAHSTPRLTSNRGSWNATTSH